MSVMKSWPLATILHRRRRRRARTSHILINNCHNATSLGFSVADNLGQGSVPTGAQGNRVQSVVTADPQFVNASRGDHHTQNPQAAAYGASAP